MKKQTLLFCLVFVLFAFSAKAQITEMYRQGFENGETATYSLSGNAATQSSLFSGGTHALKLSHGSASSSIVLDTIDLSTIGDLSAFTLEFMHICDVDPNTCQSQSLVAVIEIKRPGVNDWTTLSQTYYNTTEGGSEQFSWTSSFSNVSYNDWSSGSASNSWWKHERFDLDNYFRSVAVVNRKLQVRFTLMARSASGSTNAGWYIDDIIIKASSQAMVKPTLSMVSYPDRLNYPTSRGVRIAADITTSVSQGVNNDSVYVEYRVGSSQALHRAYMTTSAAQQGRYEARIPFLGYDTIIEWRLIARDATTNNNTATFPRNESAWNHYRCVRGTTNRHSLASGAALTATSLFPFPAYGDNRSEYVYDSVTLAAAGYRPGAITSLTYVVNAATPAQNRERFQIKMLNVPTSYTSSTTDAFTLDYMKVVYDGPLSFDAVGAGTQCTLQLQDTFYYAGEDFLMQVTYDNAFQDPAATMVMGFPAAANKKTIYVDGYNANMGYDVFTSSDFNMGMGSTARPHFVFEALENMPLVYDAGICAMSYPNYNNAATAGRNDSVVVWLKNFGVNTMNNIRIAYAIDGGTPVYYNWSGSLRGGDSVRVTVSTTQQFAVGYHNIKAWVEDTITASGSHWCDYEPYNDTVNEEFISCAGAMSGVRHVGSEQGDFATLDGFLFSLARCGVNGQLTVKLAPGTYDVSVFPSVPGISAENYVLFEPETDGVVFNSSNAYSALVDLQEASNIRFNNIGFVRSANARAASYLVRLSHNSTNCQFTDCWFEDHAATGVSALLSSGGADNLVVERCRFEGGAIGVDMSGQASDNRATGNRISHSQFSNQNTNAVSVVNQNAVVVDSNVMNDVRSNASYILLARHCYGASRLTANKIFTSHGASALGVADIFGTATAKCVIANNMIVCNDDGVSNMLSTPMNIISAQHTKVVYNSLKLTATERSGVAAAALGGGALSNVNFQNNVITCFDANNFAFNFVPGNATGLVVGNNVYYSVGDVLNKYSGSSCGTLAEWQRAYPSDAHSRCADPNFLNGAAVDLRTYNQQVKGCGVPVAEVTTDMFGNARDANAPCAGAFEFVALFYDFTIEALDSPEAEYCNAPAAIPLNVVVKNTGVQAFDPATSGNLQLSYNCGAQTGTVSVTQTIPAGGSTVCTTGRTLSLPVMGRADATYNIKVWVSSTLDPNATNDTNMFTVVSHYHPAAPAAINQTVAYASTATITATNGLDEWPLNFYDSGRKARSTVYWFADSLSQTPLHRGNTFTTQPIYADTALYIEQRRDLPLMKITEVQISRTGDGVTSPYPVWFGSSTKFALELTNVGDYPANLAGDSIKIISATSSLNNKNIVLPSATVLPGQSIVLQFQTGSTTDSSATLFVTKVEPTYDKDFAVFYKHNGIADAVAFNGITSLSQWTAENVPATVWQGGGITLNSTQAGVKRSGWPSNPVGSPVNSNQFWAAASNSNRMTLGTPDPALQLYADNGCAGDRAKVTITLSTRPTTDIFVEQPTVPEGCGLGDEQVSVVLHNYGQQASSDITIHYSCGGTTCTDVITGGLAAGASLTHVFSQTLNMRVQSDSVFNVMVWVDNSDGDIAFSNDTARGSFAASFTPSAPVMAPAYTADYGLPLTITPTSSSSRETMIWYDADMNVLDTAATYTTPLLYHDETLYVRSLAMPSVSAQIGSGAAFATASPAPYCTAKKYAKEQYLYTATELSALGLVPGPITFVSFYLDSLLGTAESITFEDYQIAMGLTSLTAFNGSGNNWVATTPVYGSNDFTITKSSKGWMRHKLTSPFVWDGTSSIVVQVCRSLSAASAQGPRTCYTSAANKALYKNSDSDPAICSTTSAGTRNGNRPNILFEGEYGCEGPLSPVVINVQGVPEYEAALAWPAGFDTVSFNSCGSSSVSVVVSNRGANSLSDYSVKCSVDGGTFTTQQGTAVIAPGDNVTMTVLSAHQFTPGRHVLRVVVNATGDDVHSNDTIVATINVRFCGGTYTIGTGADYPTFTAAVDTLHNAGIVGPVVFNVAAGSYNEQAAFAPVNGCSDTNTITFQSATGEPSDVILYYAPSNSSNYVLSLDNVAHLRFNNMTVYSAGSSNYSNAVVVGNVSDVSFYNDVIRVKGTVNNEAASCVVVNNNVNGLSFTRCVIDSGYCSLVSNAVVAGEASHITVDSCTLTNFRFKGISLSNVYDITVHSNTIRSSRNDADKALTGISIDGDNGLLLIDGNNVVLKDAKKGVKTGIVLNNSQGTNINRLRIYNNMVALSGTGNSSGVCSGITIDGTSKNVNVYFNTVRLYTSDNKNTTTAFKTGSTVSNVYVLNNIFSNFSMGYAYYVTAGGSVNTSNYNNYYSSSSTRLAYWGAECADFATLCTTNGTDANSLNVQPYFMADDDLHLTVSNMSARAQYNSEIPVDIDGTIRPQIPAPTIGAHEFPIANHDVTVAEITKPVFNLTDYVESAPFYVHVKIYNNGATTERNLSWYAELDGVPNTTTATRTIRTLNSGQMYIDSVLLTPPLGIIDTQYVVVHLDCPGDANPDDNEARAKVFLSPAFDLKVSSLTVPSGCHLHDAQVKIKLKNVGRKAILGTEPITIGYEMTLKTADVVIPTLPVVHEETITLGADLPKNIEQEITFSVPANLYPTGYDGNIKINSRGWVAYRYDLKPENDTTTKKEVNSYYTPKMPVGEDLHIPYATWDTLWATQENNRPIRWYRDSTQAPFYSNNTYARSCHWDNAPQYFHDSTYYLNCLSDKNCASYFSEIHVVLNPRVNADVAAIEILSPQSQMVYTENDTVRVKITNYSNRAIANIPVVFQILQGTGNNIQEIQRVTEVCTATINQDQEYVYKFDSLMVIPENFINQNKNYQVRAWTDLPTEMIRMNDTVRTNYTFKTLSETSYCTPEVNNAAGLDITRVSFNTLEWEVAELGRTYLNFGTYSTPEVASIHLTRGTTDTITVECASSDDPEDHSTIGRVTVCLDYNRNGSFSSNELLASFITQSRMPSSTVMTIPADANYGYMKLRVMLNEDTSAVADPCEAIGTGNVQDYLVYIDPEVPANDVAATRIVTQRNPIIDSSFHHVGFSMANKGSSAIQSVDVHYTYENISDSTLFDSTYTWTGNIAPGCSQYVVLPAFNFNEGTTNLTIVLSAAGDANPGNDTLHYQYHRFHVIVLSFEDNFDDDPDMWYAPRGSNDYTYNYWQRGTPLKSHISSPCSQPNVWITGLKETVAPGKRGTHSVLYSPIIDISTIRCDTLSFMMAKNMSQGSYLTMEYFNYRGYWVTLDASSEIAWYDDEAGFTGNSTGYGYDLYKFPTSIISGEFPELLQFRFVYSAPTSNSATANYGDGCAIDNFSIKRGQRATDAGVVSFIYPTEPQFGQTIAPKVVIKNYGYDTLRSVPVAYRPYGSFLPHEETYVGAIPPNGGIDTFAFSPVSAFAVTNNFPDTFQMCAFTRSTADLYHDNDTACQMFVLHPLDNDMAMLSYLSPLDRIVAGDSVVVRVRMRNYGQAEVSSTEVACVFNGSDPVTETVDFEQLLGRPLRSMEYFNYTFHHKFRSSMGTMSLSTYCKYQLDDYLFNDTITKSLSGIAAITDLRAREIIVDTSSHQNVRIQLVVDNVGARLANYFEVGFFLDNDSSTVFRQIYNAELGIPSLSSGFILFDTLLPTRTASYRTVCAFVHIEGDNDVTNDTTTTIAVQYVDVNVRRVLIEENRYDTCHVRLEVENVGNLTVLQSYIIDATINGTPISTTLRRPIAPGQIYHLDFDATIPKSPSRTYVGVGSIDALGDVNHDNDQTDSVIVVNYFEGIPLVDDAEGYALGQNHPNPFHNATAIEFRIPSSAEVCFFVTDLLGRLCYQQNGHYGMGEHQITLPADLLSEGVYFYGIVVDGHRLMRKMIVK